MTDAVPSVTPSTTPGISVLVCSKDQQADIGDCLRGLPFSDDIVVLDDFSRDATPQIVRSFPGVRLVQRAYDDAAGHRNWALDHITFKHSWLLQIDADEQLTPELRDELRAIVADPHEARAAFYVERRTIFRARWLKHAAGRARRLRFFRPPAVRFDPRAGAPPIIRGDSATLHHYLLHYGCESGLVPWLSRHNEYSRFQFGAARTNHAPAPNQSVRHLPGRGTRRFLYTYLVRGGFLDGVPGLRYCLLIGMYEYWLELKNAEARHDWPAATRQLARRLVEEPNR
jgi:glycosyltransferase involved in cell wall biosynthesis